MYCPHFCVHSSNRPFYSGICDPKGNFKFYAFIINKVLLYLDLTHTEFAFLLAFLLPADKVVASAAMSV